LFRLQGVNDVLQERTLRITIVTPSLSGGGAERSVALLSKGFLKENYKVTIVTLNRAAADSFALPDSIDRRSLDLAKDSRSSIHGFWNNCQRLVAMRKAIQATQPDVVISSMSQTNVLTTIALLHTNYAVVLMEHSDPAINTPQRTWRQLRRVVYPWAAMLVSVNHGINDYFKWLPASKKAVIANPVSTSETEISQNQIVPSLDPHKKRIVAMGRLIHVKGFDRLLLAFAKLAKKHPDWEVIIMGEGELRSDLSGLIQRLDLTDRVRLVGFVKSPFVVLQGAQLFVLPSRSEGFPYALLEAMSCGVPAVAMNCTSGPREIIRDGIDGFLVPDGDIEGLASAMDRLMTDANERQRLAARAPEVLERFKSEKIIAQWEALFMKLSQASQVVIPPE
jgi:glycosyltransferase involved in cell wall biosynthesis